ncbi:MAG: PQQ-like beta-propeller repeat protein, partial [Prolixibacteraceae bacterium]|nr:PQQ-like beta-propeller repeat protein [Prolixibacteraceae bacterium]
NVVALNRFTGELVWKNKGKGERSAYTQSILIKLPQRNLFVTFSAYNFLGFDADTGELLWVHPQDNTPLENRGLGYGDTHCNGPLYEDGMIYYCAGDGNCGVKLKLSEDGSKITQLWRNNDFDGYMGGIIKIGDYIYGTGTAKKALHSVDANTGELVQSLNVGTGAVIAANNMLYYYTQRGELFLIKAENGSMETESSFRVRKGSGEHFSHPVINDGILYQRHGNVLMAFNIKSVKPF